jgi:ribosomal-protein-alanine N-acetyltransferase
MTGITFPIETPRLRIRPMIEADASDLHELYSDKEAMKYLTTRTPSTVEESRDWVRAKMDLQESDGLSMWSIVEKASGHVIGDCGLQYEDEGRTEVGLGFRLRRASWHQGFAFESSAACLAAGFEQLGLDRILSMTHADNLAAQRLMHRLGMEFLEGRTWSDMPMVVHVTTDASHHLSALPSKETGR